jgi:hypothetical protein
MRHSLLPLRWPNFDPGVRRYANTSKLIAPYTTHNIRCIRVDNGSLRWHVCFLLVFLCQWVRYRHLLQIAGLINFCTLSYDGSLVRKRSTVHCILPANYSLPDDFYKWNECLQGSL